MKFSKLSLTTIIVSSVLALSAPAQATIVLVKTSLGDFEVNLLDNETPETVANFLTYVNDESYSSSVIHRSVPGFIVQGGGFIWDAEQGDSGEIDSITRLEPVVNEPKFSNVRGTVAMAKQSGDADSATNQWFVNVADNSENLDNQNGGFTVFGVVSVEGMEILDAINELDRYNLGGAFNETPLRATPGEGEFVTDQHLVMVESVTVTNVNVDTEPTLPPLAEEAPVDPEPEPEVPTDPEDDNDSSSGGSTGLLSLFALLTVGFTRRLVNK